MSNFLIFKAAFNNSATPAIGTYTAEGATAYFNRNLSLSPDYYLYGNTAGSAVRWFVPTAETTDLEFVADILITDFSDRVTYFIIADGTGTTRLRMWSLNNFVYLANDDSNAQSGTQFIGRLAKTDIGGFEIFHQFRVRVRKLTESSSSVEVYVDGTLKLTATAGAALVTCAKIGFMGGVNDSVTLGNRIGIQNTYVYDLSGGDVIDRGVLSGAFNRFISWAKGIFALKSDIPTVNNGTLTIRQNGTDVQTFTANQATAATANIQCVDLSTAQTIAGDKDFIGTTGTHDVIPATTGTYDLGSSAKEYNNAYIKALTVNGTAAGDILTHNASEFVPVSGGNVMTSSSLGRTVDTDELRIDGGAGWNDGASIGVSGKSRPDRNGHIVLHPATSDASFRKDMWIMPDGTWTWSGTAVQIISDQRLKQQIAEIDDALLDAWKDVELCQFKYNDAVDQKGKDKARLHTGYVVQQIDKACKEHDVDISAYGLYCHEEYAEETEEVEVEQKDGTKTKERKVIREASEHYSLRYTEALIVECKYLRRCIARLTARIEQLEKDKEQEASK